MTWQWRICFSLLASVAALLGENVSGKIELRDSARKTADYSGVVVWLEPASGAHPRVPAEHVRMVQKNKTFTPHVLAITVGTTVDFPNFDPIFHNAFSSYNGQVFDVGLYPPGSSRSVQFTRPGIVRVFCNIHANMSAIIAVLDTPWFAATRRDGSYTIAGVPPGEYVLHVFHERATPATLDALTRRIVVRDEPLNMAAMAVSESGYLAIPHKNKYGHDYPPAPDAGGAYPAVRP